MPGQSGRKICRRALKRFVASLNEVLLPKRPSPPSRSAAGRRSVRNASRAGEGLWIFFVIDFAVSFPLIARSTHAASIDRKLSAFNPTLRSRPYRRRSDGEGAIRLLIALMVLRCDPLAISLTAAASARDQPRLKPHLVRS
jgi:hypothetical protein